MTLVMYQPEFDQIRVFVPGQADKIWFPENMTVVWISVEIAMGHGWEVIGVL